MTVKKLIISEIEKKNKINIDTFIDLSLFSTNGYYSKVNPIGNQNDFITAPEISQMFGEVLGSFIINYWETRIGKEFNLIELGPGKGTLLKDILRVSNLKNKFCDSINLTLIEKNKELIKLQKSSLGELVNIKAVWEKNFKINNNLPSIIYSNEFFDCFPIRQFYKKEKWYEKFIKYDQLNDLFRFTSELIDDKSMLKKLHNFDNIGVVEISESRKKYFDNICKFIKKNKGTIITIDYGYKNLPSQFSLQSISNHKKTHLFDNLGSQDITSFVNFDELICVAKANELKIDIFCQQKEFLITYGLEERKDKLKKNQNNIELEFNRLIEDSQMGSNFKVLVVSCQ